MTRRAGAHRSSIPAGCAGRKYPAWPNRAVWFSSIIGYHTNLPTGRLLITVVVRRPPTPRGLCLPDAGRILEFGRSGHYREGMRRFFHCGCASVGACDEVWIFDSSNRTNGNAFSSRYARWSDGLRIGEASGKVPRTCRVSRAMATASHLHGTGCFIGNSGSQESPYPPVPELLSSRFDGP